MSGKSGEGREFAVIREHFLSSINGKPYLVILAQSRAGWHLTMHALYGKGLTYTRKLVLGLGAHFTKEALVELHQTGHLCGRAAVMKRGGDKGQWVNLYPLEVGDVMTADQVAALELPEESADDPLSDPYEEESL